MASEGRKVGSLKRRVRSHLARWEMKTCTPLWREAQFEVKMYKTPQVRSTFGSWDLEKKVHAVVTWSTFPSQNVQNTSWSCLDRFWKLRCRKSARCWGARCWGARCWSARCWGARCCGAKHISKSKCAKHTTFRALLEVDMFKKCTPLRCEAHFEVKMYKTHNIQTTFGRLRSYNDNYSYDYN